MDRSKSYNRYLSLDKIKEVVFFLAIIYAPTNLFLAGRPAWAYLDGIFIDYWAPKLPASILLVLLLCFIEAYQSVSIAFRQGKLRARLRHHFRSIFAPPYRLAIGMGILFLVIGRQLMLPSPWPALAFLAITLAGPGLWLAFLLSRRRFVLPRLVPAILAAAGVQSFLACYQFFFQIPLAPYWLLGEPRFSPGYLLAASELPGPWQILPYGSTPHPNVLAGWMLLGILAAVYGRMSPLRWLLAAVFTLVLLSTQSWTAVFSLAICLFILINRQKMSQLLKRARTARLAWLWPAAGGIGLTALWNGLIVLISRLNWLSSPSFSRRADLMEVVLEHWRSWWLSGAGLLAHLNLTKLAPFLVSQGKFLQPVHSSLLVLATDLGIWTLLLLFTFMILVQFYYSSILILLLGLLPIFSLDHFAVTTASGQFLTITLAYFLFTILTTFKPVSIKK